jgi:nitroimidazol reductase NimA-like FMN-containing flavoprotein (pyridoxamine 5'-phosphate oxidase superfamily)
VSENDESGSEQTDPGVVARRIDERRAQLGLTEDDLATEAGMSPRYLQHLLQMGLDFDPGGMRRIAAALGVTYEELLEGRRDAPPGQTGPGPRPVLVRLSAAECWDKLGTHGVGRVALPVEPGPAVFPVNYAVDAGTIVYRTAPGGSAAPETGAAVSFQVDRMDDELSQGWSVLVTGAAERVDDPAAGRRLSERHAPEPWAGGDRPLWVRIRPDTVTGRGIATM